MIFKEDIPNGFFVYAYLDPSKIGNYIYGDICLEAEPFYVGKGCGYRARKHLYKDDNYNKFKERKISKIKREFNLFPLIKYLEIGLTNKKAIELEIKIISLIGRRNLGHGPLTNLTNGGDGCSGYIFTKEERFKISQKLMGHKVSKETREKISIAHTGKKYGSYSKERKIKISKAKMGNIVSNSTKTKISKSLKLFYEKQHRHKYIVLECSFCGIKFEKLRSKTNKWKNHYCSQICLGHHRRKEQKASCFVCGKPIVRKKYQIKKNTFFLCSNECRSNFYKEKGIGKNVR